jgi:hypothetical protein
MTYHNDYSRISKTMLQQFCESPAIYNEIYNLRTMQPKAPTKAMELGTILHAVLLEDKRLDEIIAVYPESCLKSDGSLNGKPAAQFREDNPGVVCVKNADHIHECLQAVTNSFLREWLSIIQNDQVYREKFIKWEDILPCRALVDCFYVSGDAVYVYDIKCTAQFPPNAFNRTARNLRYWLQEAHYSIGLKKLYDRPIVWRWVVIETVKPYRVQMRWYDSRSAEIARDYRNSKMRDLKSRMESGDWSDGYEQSMVVNPWEVETEDDGLDWESVE